MQYKEIEVSLGLTVSPRQYESIRADARVLLEVASGDDYTEAFVSARNFLEEQVGEQVKRALALTDKGGK